MMDLIRNLLTLLVFNSMEILPELSLFKDNNVIMEISGLMMLYVQEKKKIFKVVHIFLGVSTIAILKQNVLHYSAKPVVLNEKLQLPQSLQLSQMIPLCAIMMMEYYQ